MNALIYAAANDTRGEVLVNNKGEPAITAYHACCGGITAHASVEWNRDLPYLMPVNDPFCNESTHRNWTQTIPLNEWTAYLEKTGFYAPTDNLYKLKDAGRQKYLDEENERLPLTGIRKDLKLRSSYFHITRDNGEVTFHGHGYGHGLGMCQEGAMQMAKLGYCYVDILMFYYNNVKRAFLKP
jgi:stage II sporulation protein D